MFDIFHCWHVKRFPLENPEKIVPLRMTELDMIQMDKNMRYYIQKYLIPKYPEIGENTNE